MTSGIVQSRLTEKGFKKNKKKKKKKKKEKEKRREF